MGNFGLTSLEILCFLIRTLYALDNVSLMKNATMSTRYNDKWVAGKAVDGNTDQNIITGDSCVHTERRKKEAWWRVDLGAVKNIAYVTICYRTDYWYITDAAGNYTGSRYRYQGFSLYVSDTPEWTTSQPCFHHQNNTWLPWPEPFSYDCKTSGRYVTFYNMRNNSTSMYNTYSDEAVIDVCEVQVMGCGVTHYGDDCQSECTNCKGGRCYINNGTCFNGCNPGYQGPKCDTECVAGTYGEQCSQRCSGNCNTDNDKNDCDHVNGTCLQGCSNGWLDDKCDRPCDRGFYGQNCLQQCSGNCWEDGDNCTNTDGACRSGCMEGWKGFHCSDVCDPGTFGRNCDTSCSNCRGGVSCDRFNGTCHNGCSPGWREHDCLTECDPGSYGEFCQQNCSENCYYGNKQCHHTDGECEDGCKTGWLTPYCATPLVNVVKDYTLEASIGVGGAFLFIALLIGFICWRKRRSPSKRFASPSMRGQSINFGYDNETTSKRNSLVSAKRPSVITTDEISQEKPKEACSSIHDNIEHDYDNVSTIQEHNIEIRNFENEFNKRSQNSNQIFIDEYQSLPYGEKQSSDTAKLPHNITKNRFKNSHAFDHSRVILERNEYSESDYINANYIKNASSVPKYIATQGPKEETIIDFWQMIWQEKISIIVMLTNLKENGKTKCAQYWPRFGATMKKGCFVMTLIEEKEYSFYTIRRVSVHHSETKLSIKVQHFLFTNWPDHGTVDSLQLLLFHNKVRKAMLGRQDKTSKLIVHCSAGVGRTGTFIAVDALIEEMKNSTVNIFQYVKSMRQDRMNMIQTQDQYIVVYKTLMESMRTDFHPLTMSEFINQVKGDKHDDSAGRMNITQQFKDLQRLKVRYTDDDCKDGRTNASLNVDQEILPVDKYRLYLSSYIAGRSDYINAVLIEANGFFITNLPIETTVFDFLRLLVDHDVSGVVILRNGDTVVQDKLWLPEEGCEVEKLPFKITRERLIKRSMGVEESDIFIHNMDDDKTQHVRLFHAQSWPIDCDSTTVAIVINMICRIMSWRKENKPGNIVVASSDGCTGCDIFCAVHNALEQLQLDDEVDIYNIVRQLQIRRPQFFKSLETYKLCYDAVADYLGRDTTYANI